MNNKLTAKCNHCQKITEVAIKVKYHQNKVHEHYFKCTHCKYHYTAFVTDEVVRKMQDSMTMMPRKNGKTYYYIDMMKQIEQRMNQLKDNLIQSRYENA